VGKYCSAGTPGVETLVSVMRPCRRWYQIANIVQPSTATTARMAKAIQASASLSLAR
jgi:hypothetical protein